MPESDLRHIIPLPEAAGAQMAWRYDLLRISTQPTCWMFRFESYSDGLLD